MERGPWLWAFLAVSFLSAAAQGLQVNRLDGSTITPAAMGATVSRLMKAGENDSVKPVPLLGSPSPADVTAFEEARGKVLSWPRTLPNLVCQQSVDRFVQHSQGGEWKRVDTVTAEVTHVDGRDSYNQISINGKPARVREMSRLPGYALASEGEFSDTPINLLSPDQAQTTEFTFREAASLFDHPALIFDFRVKKGRNTTWQWWYQDVFVFLKSPVVRIYPDYIGTLWIDALRHEVLRVEMQAVDVDIKYPYDKMRETIDYDHIQAGDSNDVFAAIRAEIFDCQRSRQARSRNLLIFKDCKKFVVKSRVLYKP